MNDVTVTTIKKDLIGAYYLCDEWQEIPLINSNTGHIIEDVKKYSMRRNYLCGVFEAPYQVGSMIFDKPLMLFLHGVRYNREDYELVDLETIIDNAKNMGI